MDNSTPQSPIMPDLAAIERSNKQKLMWGLVCLIGPTALLIVSLVIYALVNLMFSSDPANDASAARTIINVILFLIGALVTLTWLPGVIVGIILLASRKSVPRQ